MNINEDFHFSVCKSYLLFYFIILLNKSYYRLFVLLSSEDSIRVEELPSKYFTSESANHLIEEFASQEKNLNTDKDIENATEDSVLDTTGQRITSLPLSARLCYAVLYRYLKDFKLGRVLSLTRFLKIYYGYICFSFVIIIIVGAKLWLLQLALGV